MILFTHTISSRLRFVSGFIGKELTGDPIRLTCDLQEFNLAEGPRIYYDHQGNPADSFIIRPHALLFEKGIREQQIKCTVAGSRKIFFQSSGDHPFDIFAACFYLLSRYEEYLPHEKDEYGRYGHVNSIAFRENFLHLPLINYWLKDLGQALAARFPAFKSKMPAYRFMPTYDIDEAWAHRHKGWIRTWGGLLKAFVTRNGNEFRERRKTLLGKGKDPYDSYDWLDELHRVNKSDPRYFFLVPERNSKYDRNILPSQKELQDLVRRHAQKYMVGVHPSWRSGDDPSLIREEIETIEKITGKKIIMSRQHYIRFTLPDTFRHLLAAGIREDYSMGYGTINGFRASVASSYNWYDLEKEETTELLLYPFCYMEANSFYEQKIGPAQALEEMKNYAAAIRASGGIFCLIWHNSFLGSAMRFNGWKEVYEEFVREQSS